MWLLSGNRPAWRHILWPYGAFLELNEMPTLRGVASVTTVPFTSSCAGGFSPFDRL